MGVRLFQPTTPGRRGASSNDFAEVTRSSPERSLTEAKRATGGRNNHGRVTSRHRGGGHRRRLRIVDFRRDKDGVPARVETVEYDPGRTCRVALLSYADGERRYILAPRGLAVGRKVLSGPAAEPEVGNAMPLSAMPLGTEVHAVELAPGGGGKLARSAGCAVRLMAREGGYALLVLPSGETRRVPEACRATIGTVGNEDQQHVILGKAGRSRWLGIRPRVRGMAMNPCDHPMGGGSGRRKGRQPQSPTGVPAKGGHTRSRRAKASRMIIVRRVAKRMRG
jgi:large subunit ribosomal protein L2